MLEQSWGGNGDAQKFKLPIQSHFIDIRFVYGRKYTGRKSINALGSL